MTTITERLLEADRRRMWRASDAARKILVQAVLEAEGWEEERS
jgi:cobalamin biosynthesis Mg chelatase CobN